MVVRLTEKNIEEMLDLQRRCVKNRDIFLPTSREGYLRAFRFCNFCFGYMAEGRLIAFLNCSVPTKRSGANLGRGRVPEEELDRVGHMNTLLVEKGCRHTGIGRELVRESVCKFERMGLKHIFVTVSPDNGASQGLLCKMGFEPLEVIRLQGEERRLFYRRISAKHR